MILELVTGAMMSAGAAPPPKSAPPPPPTPLTVTAPGTTLAATVSGTGRDRYELTIPDHGTVLITVKSIHGPSPKGWLKTSPPGSSHGSSPSSDGLVIRRTNGRGETYARPPAGSKLIFEVTSTSTESCTYLLSVAIDVDRPPEHRGERRPARPRDVIGLPEVRSLSQLEHVLVDGILAESAIANGELYVTMPAYAHNGDVTIVYADGRPSREIHLAMIGAEPDSARVDMPVAAGACEAGGCIELHVASHVGTIWLAALAKAVDADIIGHAVVTGVVTLKLRLPSSEAFTLSTLTSMPGVISARSLDPRVTSAPSSSWSSGSLPQ